MISGKCGKLTLSSDLHPPRSRVWSLRRLIDVCLPLTSRTQVHERQLRRLRGLLSDRQPGGACVVCCWGDDFLGRGTSVVCVLHSVVASATWTSGGGRDVRVLVFASGVRSSGRFFEGQQFQGGEGRDLAALEICPGYMSIIHACWPNLMSGRLSVTHDPRSAVCYVSDRRSDVSGALQGHCVMA